MALGYNLRVGQEGMKEGLMSIFHNGIQVRDLPNESLMYKNMGRKEEFTSVPGF